MVAVGPAALEEEEVVAAARTGGGSLGVGGGVRVGMSSASSVDSAALVSLKRSPNSVPEEKTGCRVAVGKVVTGPSTPLEPGAQPDRTSTRQTAVTAVHLIRLGISLVNGNNAGGNTDDGSTGRYVIYDNSVGPNFGPVPDFDIA